MAARMRRHVGRRVAVAILIACCSLGIVGAAAARHGPEATTQAATDVSATAATLHGTVTPDKRTSWFFQYGTTTEYGSRTPVITFADDDDNGSQEDHGHGSSENRGKGSRDDDPVAVDAVVGGLAPSTTYHFELVAIGRKGVVHGGDFSFQTAPAPLPIGVAPGIPFVPGPPATLPVFSSTTLPPPVLGVSVNLTLGSGFVAVRTPGATAAVALTALASLPVGSLIDTRRGSVTLRSALPNGRTQLGTFHGGLFQVRQGRRSRGFVELVLRGAKPRCGGARAAAVAPKKRKPRRLWGKDRHGRFRTRGSNSVATVRGTEWLTEDRCAGTLTRVKHGRVSVRDLRLHRTVTVRAGHTYLARKRG
jgi:hypothetical protein